jgi:hypothetical protein
MHFVRVAAGAVLLPLDALGMQALVLVGEVIAVLAGLASENDFFAGHCCLSWLTESLSGESDSVLVVI